uniref:Putative nicotinic acetylcholine receptor 11 n=1 Tax=Hirudo verbana TaxID=311461 RepID=A0A2S1WLW0_9ANNE|nr:putative nicotinic acetylcholine receptor 11 [Hirudo verbana]
MSLKTSQIASSISIIITIAVPLLLFIFCLPGTRGSLHEERLIHDIFNDRAYQKLARPVANENDAVDVNFGLTLMQIIKVDEKNEFLHTNLWLNFRWWDYKLGWNKSDYGGIESIRLSPNNIWTPDILLYNSADEKIDSKFYTNIVVHHDGYCEWIPLGLFISACSIDIQWFPFDDQYCKMKFGSWSYDENRVNLTKKSDTVDLSAYQPSGEWDLLEAPAKRNVIKYACCPETYIDITFTIHIRRRTLYYGFNLIIPCALISMLTLLTFVLPPDEGEKIGLGITILLSLSVFQLIVADMVPATSLAVPLVGVYFACVMIMCSMSVIMTVMVLNFHNRSPDMYEMPVWVKRVICEWLAWSLRMSRPGRDLSRKVLLRKARLRELEAKTPPSLSLISNVKDLDNHIPLQNSEFFLGSNFRSVSMEAESTGSSHNVTSCMGHDTHRRYLGGGMGCHHGHVNLNIRNELLAILNELRFITKRMKEDSDKTDETNDWKFAAMVIDRLCFWIFSTYLFVTTTAIFLSPSFDYRPSISTMEEINQTVL